MALVVITNISASKFSINGREMFKTFIPKYLSETRISAVNIYDSTNALFIDVLVSEIEVDGVTYANATLLVTALSPIVFISPTGGTFSQEQIDANTAAILALQNGTATATHNHNNLYYLKSEIDTIINNLPAGTEIASGAVVNQSLRFYDSIPTLLFSVDVTKFFEQGNNLTFANNILSLTNVFGTTLSSIQLNLASVAYDNFIYRDNILADFSNIVDADTYLLVLRTDARLFFLQRKTDTTVLESARWIFEAADFMIDFSTPTIENDTFNIYEITELTYDFNVSETYTFDFRSRKTLSESQADKLDSYPVFPETPEGKVLSDDGTFKTMAVATGGFASNIYFSQTDSDIAGYKSQTANADAAETVITPTVSAAEGDKLLYQYLYAAAVGVTSIPSGAWSFAFVYYVNSANGVTQLGVRPFRYTQAGVKEYTFPAIVWSEEIENTVRGSFKSFPAIQQTITVAATDRLGCDLYIKTTSVSAITVNIVIGDGSAAFMNSPLPVRHSALRDKDGEADFQHITLAQKTELENLIAGATGATYAQLQTLIASNSLVVGQKYILSDYYTKHVIPNSSPVEINVGSLEPLILTAANDHEFHTKVISTIFPSDIIRYRFDDNSCEDGTRDVLNKKWTGGTARNGYITYRKSTTNNLEVHNDWRNYKVRRWKLDCADWVSAASYTKRDVAKGSDGNIYVAKTTHTGLTTDPTADTTNWQLAFDLAIQASGGFLSFTPAKDNFIIGGITPTNLIINNTTAGTDYQDYYQFCILSELTNSTGLLIADTFGTSGQGFNGFNIGRFDFDAFNALLALGSGLESNVFYLDANGSNELFAYSNKIGWGTYNTIAGMFYSNMIGDNYALNIIFSNFYSNITGTECYMNIIRGEFYNNIIGDRFYGNIVENYFYSNRVVNDFIGNIIGAGFYGNIVDEAFKNNTLGNDFYKNIIGAGGATNIIGNNFHANSVGSDFRTNIIGNDFHANSVGSDFQTNSIADNFMENKIESVITSTDFTSATHVYADYNCTIFKNAAGTLRLSYFNASDVLTVVDITA